MKKPPHYEDKNPEMYKAIDEFDAGQITLDQLCERLESMELAPGSDSVDLIRQDRFLH